MLNEVSDDELENIVVENKFCLNKTSKINQVHRKYGEKKVCLKPGLFNCEQV